MSSAREERSGRYFDPERDRRELERLIEELGIFSASVRAELEEDVPRAVRILTDAARRRGQLRSAAGYAIAQFRSQRLGVLPELELLTVPELEAALEYARSVELPTIALQSIELELERSRWYAERLEEARAEREPEHVQERLG